MAEPTVFFAVTTIAAFFFAVSTDLERNGGLDLRTSAIVLTPWIGKHVVQAMNREIALVPACAALYTTALARAE